MKFCAIDFESTGFDTSKERITEIGAILAGVQDNKLVPVNDDEFSQLVYDSSYSAQTPEVVLVTGITDEMLRKEGISFVMAFNALVGYFEAYEWPDFFLAHNKQFDESLFKAEMKRHKEELLRTVPKDICERVFDLPWLCSIKDIRHPDKFKSKKLAHLALDYGVPVDPRVLHRAVDDVRLLLLLAEKAVVNWESFFKSSKEPWILVRAQVPSPFGKGGDGGVGKDKARGLGFNWQGEKKIWTKEVKESEIADLQAQLGYPIVVVHERAN